MNSDPGRHAEHRIFEWFAAPGIAGLGAWQIALQGQNAVLVACVIVGVLRCVVLYANGGLGWWGPHLRALASLLTALLWVQIAVMMSGLLPLFLSALVSEVQTCIRAARDFRGLSSGA